MPRPQRIQQTSFATAHGAGRFAPSRRRHHGVAAWALVLVFVTILGIALLFVLRPGPAHGHVLRLATDPVGNAARIDAALVEEFTRRTGIEVVLVKGPSNPTERLTQYVQYMGARSETIDVMQIDVIWPGLMSNFLIDLTPYFSQTELKDFFPAIIANNTIDGKLVAMPWFADAGLLYYRTDLLKEYGFADPPQTWDELETMSAKIQAGERAKGNKDFWGYLWQGGLGEAATCNILEWQASNGGGSVVERDGSVTVMNDQTSQSLLRAKNWIGSITPPEVLTWTNEEPRIAFKGGDAAFLRHWTYAYSTFDTTGSSIQGKFSVTKLPAGSVTSASTLGGWQLGVSVFSQRRDEAMQLVKFLTSPEALKARAIGASLPSTRISTYNDPEIRALPYLNAMREVILFATARPSTVSREAYGEISSIYFSNGHAALSGTLTIEDALGRMDRQIRRAMR